MFLASLHASARRIALVFQSPPEICPQISWGRELRFFLWLFLNLPVRKRALVAEFTSRFQFERIDIREDANRQKVI